MAAAPDAQLVDASPQAPEPLPATAPAPNHGDMGEEVAGSPSVRTML